MSDTEAVDMRRKSLEAKHQELELRLEEELKRPYPDSAVVAHLKKEKLRLKDQMSSF